MGRDRPSLNAAPALNPGPLIDKHFGPAGRDQQGFPFAQPQGVKLVGRDVCLDQSFRGVIVGHFGVPAGQ